MSKQATALQHSKAPGIRFWKMGTSLGIRASSLLFKFGALGVQAGAAFHLAKIETGHGDWEDAVAKHCPFSLRTVQKYMQMAEGALLKNGFDPDERSFRALTAKSSKLDDFGRLLRGKLDESLNGKSKKQLEIEFGIRRPPDNDKRKLLANPTDLDDPENRKKFAAKAASDLQDAAGRLIEAAAFTPELRNVAAWACYDVLRAALPDRKFLTQPPAGGEISDLPGFILKHCGKRGGK
jgi:hypothetical protein